MFFFFFSSRRRHTRSKRDWSSDVCSSDLDPHPLRDGGRISGAVTKWMWVFGGGAGDAAAVEHADRQEVDQVQHEAGEGNEERSEERRVGKECRSRGWGYD